MNKQKLLISLKDIPQDDIYGNYISNLMEKSKYFDLPIMDNNSNQFPDYAALGSEKSKYNLTNRTIVTWFLNDNYFDKIDGLYNAIIYKDKKLLLKFKELFNNVVFLSPMDFSMYAYEDESVLINQLRKISIVFGWMVLETDAIVFPLVTWGPEYTWDYCFSNIKKGSNVLISLKGCCKNKEEMEFSSKAIKRMIEIINPSHILVYYCCSKDLVFNFFVGYPIKNIILLNNTLLKRNKSKYGKK